MTAQDRDDRSKAFLAEEIALIPKGYSPVLHLSVTTGIGVAALIAGAIAVDAFHWRHLALALTFFVLANLVEWLAHKYLLHERRRFFEPLYDQHAPRHHVFYTEDHMAVGSRKEWRFVLMPRRGVLGIALLAVPLAFLIGALFGADAGWVVAMTVGSYASFYEISHLCYHLPDDHWVKRLPLVGRRIAWLSRHHARHHDPRLMRKWNLNVTVPIWDFLLGTNHTHDQPRTEP